MGNKSSGPIERLAKPEGFVSLSSRLALVIFALVASVSLLVAFELTRRASAHYIDSKQRAGRMLTELFAASVAPALDFADNDAVAASLDMLLQNREVVDAAVWSVDAKQPLARLRAASRQSGPDRELGTRVSKSHIDIAVDVKNPTGKVLGTAAIRVSLASENAAFASARRRIFWLAFGLSGVVAALLVAVTRRTIVSPLARLERAAQKVARGELIELKRLGRDEIGMLGRTFNVMGNAIREREERVVAVNARLQGLLDNMRQAIVVFDGEGRLAPERSRLALELFGDGASNEASIVELLYPSGHAPEIEREAFRVWLGEAAATAPEHFDELGELAPREVKLPDDRGERLLELEFRRVESERGEPRIMLLASDVTSQRKLERSAETRERDHQKQLMAMRRLLIGGGQVFVRFLASARERQQRCLRDLQGQSVLTSESIESVFRFVHTLRAEARSFDLRSVEELALAVEAELVGARHTPSSSPLRARAYETVSSGIAELSRALDAAEELFVTSSPIGRRVLDQITVSRADVDALVQKLGRRSDEVGRLVSRLASRAFGELVAAFPDSVERWAAREGKRVEFSVTGREVLVPGELSERLSGALAHLLRNAVAHGVEAPDQRRELGKPEAGKIELICAEVREGVAISVHDDGAGFDVEALERKAGGTAEGPRGLDLAFIPGVSTRERADELAGHGVGLGAVREELRNLRYLVSLRSEKGRGTTVVIEPAPLEPEAPLG